MELSSLLNVDYSQVEHAAQQIAKSDRDTHLVLGMYRYLPYRTGTVTNKEAVFRIRIRTYYTDPDPGFFPNTDTDPDCFSIQIRI